MYAVYDLFDQRVQQPFYVGSTSDVLERFRQHLRCTGPNDALNLRIRELLAVDVMPHMRTLERIRTEEEARIRETYWIHHYLNLEVELLNEDIPRPLHLRSKQEQQRILARIRKGKGDRAR